jgi:hypothetical protein
MLPLNPPNLFCWLIRATGIAALRTLTSGSIWAKTRSNLKAHHEIAPFLSEFQL